MGIDALGLNTAYGNTANSVGKIAGKSGTENTNGAEASDARNNSTDTTSTFSELVQKFREENKVSAGSLKEEKDWRDMSDEEWDKMIEGIDEYLDAYRECLKQMEEMQNEAAQKAAAQADPSMRTTAAAAAALNVSVNGFEGVSMVAGDMSADMPEYAADGTRLEKNWTKNLDTDDDLILRVAKLFQDVESMGLAKVYEAQANSSVVAESVEMADELVEESEETID